MGLMSCYGWYVLQLVGMLQTQPLSVSLIVSVQDTRSHQDDTHPYQASSTSSTDFPGQRASSKQEILISRPVKMLRLFVLRKRVRCLRCGIFETSSRVGDHAMELRLVNTLGSYILPLGLGCALLVPMKGSLALLFLGS